MRLYRAAMTYARPFPVEDSAPLAPAPARPAASKLLGLEILRFGAALAVLLNHYRFLAEIGGFPATTRAEQPLYSLLWPLYEHGNYGVEVFWGISGYIFFWKYGEAIHQRAVGAFEFFWLRFSRLYPLHLATLLAVASLQAVHRELNGSDFVYAATDSTTFAKQLFLATDWGPPALESFNGPIWSISAEVAVYAAFFLLVAKFGPSIKLCLTIVLTAYLLQLFGLNWASIGCATYFFIGGLAALAPAGRARVIGAIATGVAAMVVVTGALGERNLVPMTLMLAVPCLLLTVAHGFRWLDRWEKQIQVAGNLTYSSYLLHFPLQLMLVLLFSSIGVAPDVTSLATLLAWLAMTLIIAAYCYRHFEMPAQSWLRRRVLKGRANA